LFTVQVTNPATGAYTVKLLDNVLHAAGGNEASAPVVPLTYTITDSDTSTATGTLNITFNDDAPSFTLVNDGPDAGSAVNISALNPASTTTYNAQFADWKFGADGAMGTPSLSGTSGNVSVDPSSTNGQVMLNLKDGSGALAAKLTLNADGTDTLQVFHRSPALETDVLLTGDVTAEGPSLTKTINSSISGLVVTITGSDGDAIPNEADDEVNPSSQGWAVANNLINLNESILFSFNQSVERFSFVTDGFTGSPDNGNVGLTVRVYYDAAKTIWQDFTGINVSDGGSVEVSELMGFGQGPDGPGGTDYTSFFAVNVLSDSSQDANDGFRLNNVTVSKISSTPPPDLDFAFTLNVTDGDGDAASQPFAVHLDGDSGSVLTVEAITGTSGSDSLSGTSVDEYLIGGLGNDNLTGGGGNDTFIWNAGETGADTIIGFENTAGSAGDVLDLSDLLQGEESAIDLSGYIQVTSGANTTIAVDASGGSDFAAPDQTIVLQGVTTDLNTLLSNGSVHTDHP